MELSRLMISVTEATVDQKQIEFRIKSAFMKYLPVWKKYLPKIGKAASSPKIDMSLEKRLSNQMYVELEQFKKELKALGCSGIYFEHDYDDMYIGVNFRLDGSWYTIDNKTMRIQSEKE